MQPLKYKHTISATVGAEDRAKIKGAGLDGGRWSGSSPPPPQGCCVCILMLSNEC